MEKEHSKESSIQDNQGFLVLGIDDAGRGPVIGPMLLSGVLVNKEIEKEFKELGVADSKIVLRKKREKLEKIIKEKALAYNSQITSPAEIDTGMGIGLNLNQVEALASGAIINNLTKNLDDKQKSNLKIIIDCPSVNIGGWTKQLMDYVKDKNLNISCEHKADRDNISVGAASIISKVTRDAKIQEIHKLIGIDFGSGYPNDPKTKAFLKEHVNDFKELHIFRESWATFRTAKGEINQSKLPDY